MREIIFNLIFKRWPVVFKTADPKTAGKGVSSGISSGISTGAFASVSAGAFAGVSAGISAGAFAGDSAVRISSGRHSISPVVKLCLPAVLLIILLFSAALPGQAAYQELEGDDIYISALEEEEEYLFEVRGNARFITEDFEVSGEEADFNSFTEEVEFRDNVVFASEEIKITAGNLIYQLVRERAFFSREARVKYQGLDATAEEVEYLAREEMIYLTGGVEGLRNGEEFSAREVEIDLAEEKINLKGQARIRLPGGGE